MGGPSAPPVAPVSGQQIRNLTLGTGGTLHFPKAEDPNRIIEERDFSEADRISRGGRSSQSLLGFDDDDLSEIERLRRARASQSLLGLLDDDATSPTIL